MKTIFILPDQHAHPDTNNKRATWAGRFMYDVRPDIVVNGGDAADMASLSDYDKGKRSFVGASYKKDIEAHLDFQDKLWHPFRHHKRKMPTRIVLEGNHEHRIERALDRSPELEGTIGFQDYEFNRHYQEIIRYEGGNPGIVEINGVLFSHFFPSGIMGRPISGERPAHSLLAKNKQSSVGFHTHVLDFASSKTAGGQRLNSVVAGCYISQLPEWTGVIGRMWRSGVGILQDVEDGNFDFQWYGIEWIERNYTDWNG